MAENRIYRFAYHSTGGDGTVYVNSLHYETQPPTIGDEPAAGDVLAVIDTALRSAYKNCLPTGLTLNQATLGECVKPGSSDIPHGAALEIGEPGTISMGDQKLPNALTAIIALLTGVPIRSGRGYLAMPSVKVSSYLDSTTGRWTGSYKTALDTWAALLDNDFEHGTVAVTSIVPMVYSRTRHARGFEPSRFQVEAAVLRQKPSWRRSRTTAP